MRFVLIFVGFFTTAAVAAEPVDFTLPDLDGKQRSLSEFRGKWVIVNFWATWCPPCLEEIPDLVEFHDRHKDDDAVVIGINYEEVNEEYLREFVESHFMSYPVLRMEPVPVTGLAANFSPMPLMAPPPLGKLMAGAAIGFFCSPASCCTAWSCTFCCPFSCRIPWPPVTRINPL